MKGKGIVQFSINDKVIHPMHGAGTITGIQERRQVDETRSYFVIDIPAQRLTVHVPSHQMEQLGIRLALSPAQLPGVLGTLQGSPLPLPENHLQRQEGIGAKLGTGRAMQVAEVVRDLTGHQRQAHLTKKDTELLKRGRGLLAAEMALAFGTELSQANRAIDAALAAGVESQAGQE